MSGRRSKSADGISAGITGTAITASVGRIENSAGGLPIRTAIACSSWARVTSPSTVRRILPQRSGAQLADAEVLNELLVNPDRPAPVLLLEPPPVRERCALAFRLKVGKKPARAWATIHSAC